MATSYHIGKHFEDLIDELVKSGRYSTPSEVMCDGLALLEDREFLRAAKLEALRAEIQKGIDSGPAEAIDPREFVERIKARGRQELAAKNGK
ncbi:antitoxin ParD1/3/4 [Rhodopseudomonas rhenobacensis]|uniref:Antitoxin ParD1/3/4 n=1 Tax=Rhodopseudomonas rhenobacensis TaxID=87461 RepID=A0A7W8DY45_9BRAD|nr:type II toxin-antitoxin system ParD family antitoxin [Rhodopseudomonas rhenobacensis]MBB5045501.1 antitoxin ParD1/3/4 [Rhodopseudomonas rhenobacensis]